MVRLSLPAHRGRGKEKTLPEEHDYADIKSAVADILVRDAVPNSVPHGNYQGLSEAVNALLQLRDLGHRSWMGALNAHDTRVEAITTHNPNPLAGQDAETFRQVFGDLFQAGMITYAHEKIDLPISVTAKGRAELGQKSERTNHGG